MFEFVRTHTKLLQLLLLVLILPSFVVFGIQGYSKFTEGEQQTVAHVGGQGITQAEWDAAHRQQVERMRRQMPTIDAKLFDSPMARNETLDALVREKVLQAAATKLNLTVSDSRVAQELTSLPELAQMRKPDGSFDLAAYKAILEAQGMSPTTFEARLAQDLKQQQVLKGITQSVVAPEAVVASALDALLQQRVIRFHRFDNASYLPKTNPGDAEIEAYYKAHEAEFRAPEQATIDYVVIDLESLKKGLPVNEEELRKYYSENAARYSVAEERRARHILIKSDKDMSADARKQAKARAESLLVEVRKNPSAFAELAKKSSDDPGSAAQGGDLDFFGKGAMTKPFEDAVFAMKVGEISNLIETEFGYHIIKLEGTRGGDRKPFEAVRAGIEDEVRKQLALKQWAEKAEVFTNTVYEQADSLQPVIDKLKLEKKSATVQRTPLPGATGALASAKLLEAVFANDSVRNKRNTDAVEVGPNQLAAARITSHQPARTLALAEVKERVRAAVQAEQAAAMARKEGEARLAQLRKDGEAELAGSATVSRAKPEGLPRAALDAVLAADATKLPAFVGVEMAGLGYFVARVDKVLPRVVVATEAANMQAQYAQVWAQAESHAYYQALRKRFKVDQRAATAASVEAAASAASR
ncbi:MAG: SurA N-terminal domain-containing protein [Burkholderiales bacterium]|nr:SurA N-terminal domain-containing protein [Burkholderiales bacterium]